MSEIIGLRTWQERLSAYRQAVSDHDYMRKRVDSVRRDIAFDLRDPWERRNSWAVVVVIDPVQLVIDDLRKWEQAELSDIERYESSAWFEHDQKMSRLQQLEAEEYQHKYGIAQEHAERTLRIGYRDYGWETGSVILAMHQSALDELERLREWKRNLKVTTQ